MFADNNIRFTDASKAQKGKEEEAATLMFPCPKCGGSTRAVPLDKYHYRESGLPNVWLYGGGVLQFTCESCGHKSIAIQRESQLVQFIAMKILQRPGPLMGAEIRYLRKVSGLTQEELAERLEVGRPTVNIWERGGAKRLDTARLLHLRLTLFEAFLEALEEEGNNYLGPAQRKELTQFGRTFIREIRSFLQAGKARVSLDIEKKDDEWQALPMAA